MASSAADYRKEAEGYVQEADALPHGTRRLRFLDMAQACKRLASHTEWLAGCPHTLNGKVPPSSYSDANSLQHLTANLIKHEEAKWPSGS